MRNRRVILILITLLILMGSISFGVDIKVPQINGNLYLYDDAELISDKLEEYIIEKSKIIDEETEIKLLTTTITSLEGLDIREYSSLIFQDIELGKEDKSRILILVAPNEDKSWIEIGEGVEDSVRQAIKNSLIEEEISSYIRIGKFDNGILLGVNRIMQEIEREYDIEIGELKELSGEVDSDGFEIPWKFILIIILIGFMDIKFFNGALFYTITLAIGIGRKGTEKYDGRNDRNRR